MALFYLLSVESFRARTNRYSRNLYCIENTLTLKIKIFDFEFEKYTKQLELIQTYCNNIIETNNQHQQKSRFLIVLFD